MLDTTMAVPPTKGSTQVTADITGTKQEEIREREKKQLQQQAQTNTRLDHANTRNRVAPSGC